MKHVPPLPEGGQLISLNAPASNLAHRRLQGEPLELFEMAGRFIEEALGGIDASLDALARIIVLARLFDVDAAGTAKSRKDQEDNDASGGGAPPALTRSGSDLRSAIDSLSTDDQAILIALAWIGRGNFCAAEFDRALVMAFERQAEGAAGYLMSLPALGDLLEFGAVACGEELSGISLRDSPSAGSVRH